LEFLGKSRISQNINQLAKAANSGSLPLNHEVIEELNDACKAINWLRDTLIKAIGLKPQSTTANAHREDSYDPQGNQRAGGRQMALHLLNSGQNEHVTVREVSGFMASDVLGALNEAYALSKGTRCKQFMYSLSLNLPLDEQVPIGVFEKHLRAN